MTACHICGSEDVENLPQIGVPLKLVSSDAKPVAGRCLFIRCKHCHTLQKIASAAWQKMADEVYANYAMASEPTIFNADGTSKPRSEILLGALEDLPAKGRLLDVGCGEGHLLTTFDRLHPGWLLGGSDLREELRPVVEALSCEPWFYSGFDPAYDIPYDVIVLSHVLEHVVNPVWFLQHLTGYLRPGGRLLIAVPDHTKNPFDLVIADHCTHFDMESLSYLMRRVGLGGGLITGGILPKELVAVVQPYPRKTSALPAFQTLEDTYTSAFTAYDWKRPFGIMGSSIAAAWLQQELDCVSFFVDEDPARVGQQLAGLPIYSPTQVPEGAVVFVPGPWQLGRAIADRWGHLAIEFAWIQDPP